MPMFLRNLKVTLPEPIAIVLMMKRHLDFVGTVKGAESVRVSSEECGLEPTHFVALAIAFELFSMMGLIPSEDLDAFIPSGDDGK